MHACCAPLAVLIPLTLACAADRGDTLAAIRDSAGIQIVENPAPDAATHSYSIGTAPALVLGARDTIAEEQFSALAGVWRFENGQVVVADNRAVELRLFDTHGAFLKLLGRRGEGPGEFGRLDVVVPNAAGTVDVWDMVTHSMSSFHPSGEFAGELVVDKPAMLERPDGRRVGVRLQPRGRVSDGRYLATAGRLRLENRGSGISHDTLDLWLIDSVGGISRFGGFPAGMGYLLDTPDGWSTFGRMPFGPVGSLVVGDSSYHVSAGAQHEIATYALDGTLRRLVRVARRVAPVTDADRSRFIAAALEGLEGEHLAHERNAYEWLTWQTVMPAYDQVVRDGMDHLWARSFPDTASTASWDVFDPEGRLVATATTPAQLEVKQIGRDWLLAVTKGEMDEPQVMLYRLTRDDP